MKECSLFNKQIFNIYVFVLGSAIDKDVTKEQQKTHIHIHLMSKYTCTQNKIYMQYIDTGYISLNFTNITVCF